jgi:hypothetical protein
MPSILTVTSPYDNGIGATLRNEIATAQNGDTLVFDNSLKGKTITVGNTLDINKSLDIEGLGAKNLAISGGNQGSTTGYWRVFEVDPVDVFGQRVQVTLSGMTIENGHAVPGNVAWGGLDYGQGGGILNYGTLTVSGCTLSNNYASYGGGGIANELGGTLTISSSMVSRNFSNTWHYAGGYGGGGIYNAGAMILSSSTVTQNTGDGIYNAYSGNLTILSSIVKSNKSDDLFNVGTVSIDSSSTIG